MSTTSNTITIGNKPASALWADFLEQNKEEPPPEGYRQPCEIAKELGLSESAARCLLQREVSAGKMEMRICRMLHKGQRRQVSFYGFPQSKPKRSSAK